MVAWTPERDAVLLSSVFEFVEVRFSKELLEHCANKVGEAGSGNWDIPVQWKEVKTHIGCTPKAVSHRLKILKAKGNANAVGGGTPSKTTPAKSTPKKNARGRGRSKAVEGDENPTDDDEPSPTKKRGRKVKKEGEEEEPELKKVKREPSNEFEGVLEGGDEGVVLDEV
ncbi:hypothetical protein K469DRAFT_752622 [Zopfia rhizophila CBS 207.26]|uniref:Uncharacterized protein n=1 Tax=Zopfia rhizophila CBS 207.26 TaxID=1314779 RepID=A0A6A6DQ77_9PEZI|nr:hypothetical protein K469DRAFT_752622 [Zopfia rhizophila CBS 207.26]